MSNQSQPVAPPRFVPVKSATLLLARAIVQLRDLSVTRMQLREALGISMNPTWQEALREWLKSPEGLRALGTCALQPDEDTLQTLLGCDRWPPEVWVTDWHQLPILFEMDLYKQTVTRKQASG